MDVIAVDDDRAGRELLRLVLEAAARAVRTGASAGDALGLLAASSLVVGAAVALVFRIPVRVIGLVMGFGAVREEDRSSPWPHRA